MALTETDIERIAAAVKGQCHCNLPHEAQEELGHLMGMVKDVGGNLGYSAGIEILRENNRFISRYKKRGEKLGLAIVTFMVVSVMGGIIYIGKMGIVKIVEAIRLPSGP